MDSKDVYSSSVDAQKEFAKHDSELMEKIMQELAMEIIANN